jgi:T-complex protein 1 subunit theta
LHVVYLQYFSGLEEAVYRNINACKQFAQTVRTAYGPNGMNKMVINHIEKLFVTSDAATIIRELDVENPAAKLMILASQMQEQEIGDGTNFVVIFSGSLLEDAEDLLRMVWLCCNLLYIPYYFEYRTPSNLMHQIFK